MHANHRTGIRACLVLGLCLAAILPASAQDMRPGYNEASLVY